MVGIFFDHAEQMPQPTDEPKHETHKHQEAGAELGIQPLANKSRHKHLKRDGGDSRRPSQAFSKWVAWLRFVQVESGKKRKTPVGPFGYMTLISDRPHRRWWNDQ